MLSQLLGTADTPNDFGEKRYKQLSFYDYDEHTQDTKGWQECTESNAMCYDDSDSDIMSDHLPVDEGAVEVLSIDQIRQMKSLINKEPSTQCQPQDSQYDVDLEC